MNAVAQRTGQIAVGECRSMLVTHLPLQEVQLADPNTEVPDRGSILFLQGSWRLKQQGVWVWQE
jgi:hypothetical protein